MPCVLACVVAAAGMAANDSRAGDVPGGASTAGKVPAAQRVVAAEQAFLTFLDAHGGLGVVESGLEKRYLGRDLRGWTSLADAGRRRLDDDLAATRDLVLPPGDAPVPVNWLQSREFELLGVDFAGRGRSLDDAIDHHLSAREASLIRDTLLGKSPAEIATSWGVAPKTVSNEKTRALHKLREALVSELDD